MDAFNATAVELSVQAREGKTELRAARASHESLEEELRAAQSTCEHAQAKIIDLRHLLFATAAAAQSSLASLSADRNALAVELRAAKGAAQKREEEFRGEVEGLRAQLEAARMGEAEAVRTLNQQLAVSREESRRAALGQLEKLSEELSAAHAEAAVAGGKTACLGGRQ